MSEARRLEMFKCDDCSSVFDSSKELRIHVAQHKWGPHQVIIDEQGTKKFQCLFEGCGKIVKDRKVLRKHLLTHKPREFACDHEGCGKKFYERAKLKRHYLVHTGEKEFVCSFEGCNKKFAYKANLKTHIRTHTGHRPFACTFPGCGKSFAQASNRNSHVLTHAHNKRKRYEQYNPDKKTKNMSNHLEPKSPSLEPGLVSESLADKIRTISPCHRDTITSLLTLSGKHPELLRSSPPSKQLFTIPPSSASSTFYTHNSPLLKILNQQQKPTSSAAHHQQTFHM